MVRVLALRMVSFRWMVSPDRASSGASRRRARGEEPGPSSDDERHPDDPTIATSTTPAKVRVNVSRETPERTS